MGINAAETLKTKAPVFTGAPLNVIYLDLIDLLI